MNDKLNQIAAIEKAIRQKYGKEAIINPNSEWSEAKEKEYLEQLREMNEKQTSLDEQQEKVETDGFLINKKLLTRETTILNCPVCSKRLKTVKDDIYNNKFECCHRCYIEYVEGRKDRWLKGWRPGEK
jgi:hypothetical protein